MRNAAKHTALGEADERGTDQSLEAAGYLLGLMDVDDTKPQADLDEPESLVNGAVERLTIQDEADTGRIDVTSSAG